MNVLVDENMPRSLAPQIATLGINVQDVRDVGLLGHPDSEVMALAIATDAIIITRDRGFADPRTWPPEFTAGIIFVSLPNQIPSKIVIQRILDVLQRPSSTLLGAYTSIEIRRSLSRPVRRR